MKVPYINLGLQHQKLMPELLAATERVMSSGMFILGEELQQFEQEFADYCGTQYAVGVGNGTMALYYALKALELGEGDEVIVPPNSFLASVSAVVLAGAKPVLADVSDDYNIDPAAIERVITPQTKAIMPVHLTGRPAAMEAIGELAAQRNIAVIEDAAQAVGAQRHGQRVGSFGIMGCFSLHPLKNLCVCGDGGVITTNDESLYKYLCVARNHGLKNRDECDFWSFNSRLDALHAAMARVKLPHLDAWAARRRQIAEAYRQGISDVVQTPRDAAGEEAVYHTFVIQTDRRDELQAHLLEQGVDTKVHYPIPIHLQAAANGLGYSAGDFPEAEKQAAQILSLPVYPELEDEQIEYVVQCIKTFFE